MPPVVVAERLSRTFKVTKKLPGLLGAIRTVVKPEKTEIQAVKEVSFEVQEGELVGFLGPNGAGKTTTLKMLTGILYRSGGRAEVVGYDPWHRNPAMQRQISLVMGNKMQLWWDLPAWDGFRVLKEIYGVSEEQFKRRSDELIETLGLSEKLKIPIRQLSLGERMKCELAAALLHNPRVLFLDEPTLGLDLVSQKRIREFLLTQNKQHGTTILLTSHYMQDVAELCERVIVIDHGSLVYEGGLAELTHKFSPTRRLRLGFAGKVPEGIEKYGKVIEQDEDEAILEVPRSETTHVAARVLADLAVEDIAIEEPDVEQAIRTLFAGGEPKKAE